MKTIVQKDLLKRLQFASMNGSKVATLIIDALYRGCDCESTEILNSEANFFESKRLVSHGYEDRYGFTTLRIVVSCCTKNLCNENFPDFGNPSAPYLSENRCDITVTKFAKMFRDVEAAYDNDDITSYDFDFLESIIRINSVINVDLVDTVDGIRHAYSEDYYYPYAEDTEPTLHKSCMRHECATLPSRCADFYHNFCGAKILVATDDNGYVLGRAIVWNNVVIDELKNMGEGEVMLLDRVYFCFKAVNVMMLKKAASLGIPVRKTKNTYDSKDNFTMLFGTKNAYEGMQFYSHAHIVVPQDMWHKRGAPYVDTMTYLFKDNETTDLYLTNGYMDDAFKVAELTSTDGRAYSSGSSVCPACGDPSSSWEDGTGCLCGNCSSDLLANTTHYGVQFLCGFTKYNGVDLPKAFFNEDGTPKETFLLHNRLRRIFE